MSTRSIWSYHHYHHYHCVTCWRTRIPIYVLVFTLFFSPSISQESYLVTRPSEASARVTWYGKSMPLMASWEELSTAPAFTSACSTAARGRRCAAPVPRRIEISTGQPCRCVVAKVCMLDVRYPHVDFRFGKKKSVLCATNTFRCLFLFQFSVFIFWPFVFSSCGFIVSVFIGALRGSEKKRDIFPQELFFYVFHDILVVWISVSWPA